jgi:hypothetical protein
VVNEEESVYFVEIFLIVSLIIYEIVMKNMYRGVMILRSESAETANRICIEVSDSELNRCCECPIRNNPFLGHMSEYAIDIRFAPESSHLRVLPEFAHQDFPGLTKSSKQALEKSIS